MNNCLKVSVARMQDFFYFFDYNIFRLSIVLWRRGGIYFKCRIFLVVIWRCTWAERVSAVSSCTSPCVWCSDCIFKTLLRIYIHTGLNTVPRNFSRETQMTEIENCHAVSWRIRKLCESEPKGLNFLSRTWCTHCMANVVGRDYDKSGLDAI